MPSLRSQAQAIADSYQAPDVGRPSTFGIGDTVPELLDEIAAGNSREGACQVAGIAKATFYRWIERGESGEEPFKSFTDALKRAEGLLEGRLTRNVAKASELPQFWAAGMTLLERKYPERYGRRDADGNAPRVVVQIGIKDSDVQVQIASAPALSPSLSEDIHRLSAEPKPSSV
jgi:hypothetical protein